MRTLIKASVIGFVVAVLVAIAAAAHTNSCHSAHSCPSDHHTYVWTDANGQGWDCAKPGAPEYDPSQDTTTIVYAGYTYYCRAAGAAAPAPTPATPDQPVAPDAKCKYRKHRALPDRSCTPGKTNRVVKQSTIKKTICKKGWTKTVRPPTSVTGPMKLQSMQEYGVTDSKSNYEYDHLISLELGGSPDSTKNLWPEPHKTSNDLGSFVKDGLENHLKSEICKGNMTLRHAQHLIRTNWTKALG